eukprot:scaffold290392_cov30-Tisochrysis_lutea.AAC.5
MLGRSTPLPSSNCPAGPVYVDSAQRMMITLREDIVSNLRCLCRDYGCYVCLGGEAPDVSF